MAKILIVDDSAFARANLRTVLTRAGHEVLEVSSGAQAVQQAEAFAPDLVTLDLLMPGISGMDTLRLLLPLLPGARFIVITADIQDSTRQEMLDAGAACFMNKPVDPQVLLQTVNDLVAG